MAMPSKLKNMNLFNEGESYLATAKSVTLPKLSRKMEAYRGGGMNGPIKIDMGMGDDGVMIEWTLGGMDMTAVRQYASSEVGGVGLRFAGAYQRDDDGSVDAVEVVVRGRHEEIDMGDAAPGEDTEHKIKTNCSYYKLTVNGRVEVEIDVLNYIENVNGTDRLAAQRRAIGL